MNKSLHLKGLNGIRAIAALSVVISHTMLGLDYFGLKRIGNGWDFATYGVTMFFTLSGFLITFLLVQEKEKFSTISIKNFYIRRILRIWPLYYFYFFVVLIILSIYFPSPLVSTVTAYLFLVANIPAVLNISLPLLTHYWSLGVEEQFYLIWPWLFKKYSPVKAVTIFMISFLLLKMSLRILAPHSIGYQFIYITRFDCMAIGALAAILYTRNRKWVITICFNVLAQVISWSVLVIAAIGWLRVPDFISHDVLSFATAVIILNVAFNPGTLVNLENKILNFLGKISYGIYIYHVLLIFLLGKLLNGHLSFANTNLQLLVIFASVLTTTILVAFVSYNYFENNFLKLKDKFTKIPSQA